MKPITSKTKQAKINRTNIFSNCTGSRFVDNEL